MPSRRRLKHKLGWSLLYGAITSTRKLLRVSIKTMKKFLQCLSLWKEKQIHSAGGEKREGRTDKREEGRTDKREDGRLKREERGFHLPSEAVFRLPSCLYQFGRFFHLPSEAIFFLLSRLLPSSILSYSINESISRSILPVLTHSIDLPSLLEGNAALPPEVKEISSVVD
jgi:hypothetical protein